MGAKFSADAEDSQILVRDKDGKFTIYTGKMENLSPCAKLPVPLNSLNKDDIPIRYLFFPSSNYQGKNLHVHTFNDEDCDTPANDLVLKEVNVLKKNINYMKQSSISNSNYFQFNEDQINTPVYPKFTTNINGVDMPRYTKRSAYNKCTPIDSNYKPVEQSKNDPKKNVYVDYNNVPMKMYTDANCENEFVNLLYSTNNYNEKSNVDSRSVPINDNSAKVNYTNVRAYIDPAIKSNAMSYRTFKNDYPL